MRVTFGLTQDDLGGQISGPLGWLLVMGAVILYHRLVLRSDRATPPDPAEMPAQPPAAA
jgi:hypothetical protein